MIGGLLHNLSSYFLFLVYLWLPYHRPFATQSTRNPTLTDGSAVGSVLFYGA